MATLAASLVTTLAIAPLAGAVGSDVSIADVTTTSFRVTIAGSVAVGDSARAAVNVLSDPAGDSTNLGLVPDGLDLGTGSISLAANGKLVFTINTYNMSPVVGAQAPTFVYDWNVAVGGVDSGYFLQAGYVGGFGVANTGKFFSLCKRSGPTCDPLPAGSGTIGTPNNVVTISVVPSQIMAKAGSVIEAGSALGSTCTGVCSTWQPVAAILYNNGGDQADPAGYIVPGGAQLTVAAAGTADADIDWSAPFPVTVQPNGSYTGTFTPVGGLVSGTQYKAAARTCSGTTDAPVCVVATRIFTA